MNQTQLIAALAEKICLSKTKTKEIIDSMVEVISNILKDGDQVVLPVLGKFKNKHIAARKCRNPRTGKPMDVPAKNKLVFSASSAINDMLNDK